MVGLPNWAYTTCPILVRYSKLGKHYVSNFDTYSELGMHYVPNFGRYSKVGMH